MDTFIPIIYLLGALILILPSFLSSNNKFKVLITNFAIWMGILLLLFSFYYSYNFYFK